MRWVMHVARMANMHSQKPWRDETIW